MSQAWSHVFLNLCHNSFQTKGRLVRMVDQNGGKFERFKNFFKGLHLIQIKFFLQKFIGWHIESDKKIFFWWYGHLKEQEVAWLAQIGARSMSSAWRREAHALSLWVGKYNFALISLTKGCVNVNFFHNAYEKLLKF